MPPAPDVATPLLEFGGDPQRAGSFATVLGFEPVASPVDLLASARGATPLRDYFRARGDDFFGVHSLLRVGAYGAGAATVGLYVAELQQWGRRSTARDRARRRVARAVVDYTGDARALVVLAPQGLERMVQHEIEVVLPRVRTESDSKSAFTTVRALIDTRAPSRFHRERIRALTLDPGLSVAQIAERWRLAFSVEEVTRKFYEDYAELRDRIAKELLQTNPTHAVVRNLSEDERKAWATRQLGRVLFLWFLQAKRWLGYDGTGQGSPTYLADLWHEPRSNSGSYYSDLLHPLFFEGMGKRPSQRSPGARERLGQIPYLNGGLFRTNALEDRIEADGVVDLPDDLFDPNPERQDSVLGLLGHYHFTTRESTPDDQSVDPDPELLGRVFENLYQGDARHDSGTFYTPREIVHFMCRQALHGWLSDRTGADLDLIELVRLEAVEPQDVGDDELIDADTAQRLTDELDVVRICDPAVGSGAFLLGAMQETTQLRRGLALAAGQSDAAIDMQVAEWKRRAIQWSLYGVDINPEAVEICHLRLWLSLVLDLPSPVNVEPLPNLDFRVMAGDSLIDRIGGIVLPESLPVSEYQPPLDIGRRVTRERRFIDRWKREFESEQDNPRRLREVRDNIVRAVSRILLTYVDAAIERERQVAEAPDPASLNIAGRQRLQKDRERRAARETLRVLEKARDELKAERGFWKPFLWPVLFHEAFQDGGFDLVLANPPYIRMERLAKEDEALWKASFREVAGSRADILVYFYGRALQILRDGGWLAFVTSNSFTKRNYGQAVRRHLANNLEITTVIDFGECAIFEASVEPYVLLAKKAPLPHTNQLHGHALYPLFTRFLGRSASVERTREYLHDLPALLDREISLLVQNRFTKFDWRIEDTQILDLFDGLMSSGVPLIEYADGHIYSGIKTGLNRAFVINRQVRNALIEADPRSIEVIRPYLRGRDVKMWIPRWSGDYLIFARRGFQIDRYPAIQNHLERYRSQLERRATSHLHPWYELQQPQEGIWDRFDTPKLVWPDIARRIRFAWDESGSYIDMKVFTSNSLPIHLLPVLNSTIGNFLLHLLTSSVRGGFAMLKTSYISSFRVPELTNDLRDEFNDIAARMISGDRSSQDAIDFLVARAYGVSDDELEVVHKWFERRSLSGSDRTR